MKTISNREYKTKTGKSGRSCTSLISIVNIKKERCDLLCEVYALKAPLVRTETVLPKSTKNEVTGNFLSLFYIVN